MNKKPKGKHICIMKDGINKYHWRYGKIFIKEGDKLVVDFKDNTAWIQYKGIEIGVNINEYDKVMKIKGYNE